MFANTPQNPRQKRKPYRIYSNLPFFSRLLEKISFDPLPVLGNVFSMLRPLAEQKKLAFQCHIDHDGFPQLLGDPTRLVRIVMNIAGNAVKYTDQGKIKIHASCMTIGPGRVRLDCLVEDTGIGIAVERQKEIFEKFVQADDSITRQYGGTGLGLTIAKQLVELMGGTIGVDSALGAGSRFLVSIPFDIDAPTSEKIEADVPKDEAMGTIMPASASILVVEDQSMGQILMKKILKKFEIGTVGEARTGKEALKVFRDKSWDVILMDCHMPEMDGYATTREIRKIEAASGGHTPIVAMTADVMVGNKEKCLSQGMDDFVGKPVDQDALKEVLQQWIKIKRI